MATSTHGSRSTTLKFNETTTDPGVSDDNTAGYGVHSIWINTTSGEAFICTDASTGAANWESMQGGGGGGGGGGGDVTATTASIITETVIASGTLGSDSGSIDITSIPGTYDDIVLRLEGRSTRTGSTADSVNVYFNNDTTAANYRIEAQYAQGPSTGGGIYVQDNALCFFMPTADSPSNYFGVAEISVQGYANSHAKLCAFRSEDRRDATTNNLTILGHLHWENTSAITRITLVPNSANFVTGTRYQLVGRKVQSVVTNVTGVGALLSTTTVAFNANADTTLYTVPDGVRCVLTHAVVVAGADAGATTALSIGQDTAETDFVPANTLSNLDAANDVVIIRPIPSTTPPKNKSYAAGTVIQAQVTNQSGGATNTVYLFGFLY